MLKRFLALLFALLFTLTAQAQRSDPLAEIRQAYQDLKYDEADRMAREALERYGDFTVQELTDIHTILGLIAYNRGEFLEARRQFVSALQLTPDFQLDPLIVPPKIIAYFEDVRSELRAGSIDPGTSAARYVLLRDRRPDAALRSMVMPGWGQLYKGQRVKGWVLTGTWTASVAGALWSTRMRADAEDAYLEATNAQDIELLYDRYDRWHKTRNALIQGAALIWVVSYVDALLTQPSGRATDAMRADASWTLRVAPRSMSLAVRF